MYKHLFFDLDRTFWDVDTNQRAAIEQIYHKYDFAKLYPDSNEFYWIFREKNEELWSLYGQGKIEGEYLRRYRFIYMLERVGVRGGRLARIISEDYIAVSPTFNALVPGTIELLEYLRGKGYPMSLITNGFNDAQHVKIRHSGIDRYFRHVITSETAGFKKPHEGIFRFAMKRAGVAAAASLMVGDDPRNDIEGGAEVGMDTAYLNVSGVAPGRKPTYEIGHLTELIKIL